MEDILQKNWPVFINSVDVMKDKDSGIFRIGDVTTECNNSYWEFFVVVIRMLLGNW